MFLLSSCSLNKFIIYPIPCLENTKYSGIFWPNISLFIASNSVCVINIKLSYIIKKLVYILYIACIIKFYLLLILKKTYWQVVVM